MYFWTKAFEPHPSMGLSDLSETNLKFLVDLNKFFIIFTITFRKCVNFDVIIINLLQDLMTETTGKLSNNSSLDNGILKKKSVCSHLNYTLTLRATRDLICEIQVVYMSTGIHINIKQICFNCTCFLIVL